MKKDIRATIRNKTRLVKGLGNLLKDDTEQIYEDLNLLDPLVLEESIYETKRTAQWLIDTLTELEHYMYLLSRDKYSR